MSKQSSSYGTVFHPDGMSDDHWRQLRDKGFDAAAKFREMVLDKEIASDCLSESGYNDISNEEDQQVMYEAMQFDLVHDGCGV